MRIVLLCGILLFISIQSQGQEKKNWFDFWVGEWEVSWTKDGKACKGKNTITRILDGHALQENFEDFTNNYKGISVSIHNPNLDRWFQTWVDTDGNYMNFIGDVQGDDKIFATRMIERNGKHLQSRMVFTNITVDSFHWRWEATQDGGATWSLNWEMDYSRVK